MAITSRAIIRQGAINGAARPRLAAARFRLEHTLMNGLWHLHADVEVRSTTGPGARCDRIHQTFSPRFATELPQAPIVLHRIRATAMLGRPWCNLYKSTTARSS